MLKTFFCLITCFWYELQLWSLFVVAAFVNFFFAADLNEKRQMTSQNCIEQRILFSKNSFFYFVYFRVFKKGSPNGKITVYLGKRDFVDHITHVDPIGKLSYKAEFPFDVYWISIWNALH